MKVFLSVVHFLVVLPLKMVLPSVTPPPYCKEAGTFPAPLCTQYYECAPHPVLSHAWEMKEKTCEKGEGYDPVLKQCRLGFCENVSIRERRQSESVVLNGKTSTSSNLVSMEPQLPNLSGGNINQTGGIMPRIFQLYDKPQNNSVKVTNNGAMNYPTTIKIFLLMYIILCK